MIMSKKLEEEFVIMEEELLANLDSYKQLCERLGFDFMDHVEDLIDQVNGDY